MQAARLIREARLKAGLSQAELAHRLHTKQSVVARWETGAQRTPFFLDRQGPREGRGLCCEQPDRERRVH